jgi:RNA polymerase sigma-70 factor (family 1)
LSKKIFTKITLTTPNIKKFLPCPEYIETIRPHETYNETELLDALRQSDKEAFTELYNRYHSRVFALARSYIKESGQAEDVTADLFIKLWERRAVLNITTSFSAYLNRMIRNKCLDVLEIMARDQQMKNQILQHFEGSKPGSVQNEMDFLGQEALFEEALRSLSPQRRRVFELCRQEGKSYDETAAEMGITKHTVKQHMSLAMTNLKSFLMQRDAIGLLMVVLPIFL